MSNPLCPPTFLMLTCDENNVLLNILDHQSVLMNVELSSRALADLILQTDVVTLFKLSEINADVNALCKQPVFTDYWNCLLKRYGKNPQDETHVDDQKTHEYLPVVTMSSFDLLKGIYIYETHRRLLETGDDSDKDVAQEYLAFAVALGNFQALNKTCSSMLDEINMSSDPQKIHALIAIGKRAADLHWTPGFIMLSNIYAELASFGKNFFIKHSLQALQTAEKLEPYSDNMINNAYQGKTISEATHNRLRDWSSAKQKIVSSVYGSLIAHDINQAYREASRAVASIMSMYSIANVSSSVKSGTEYSPRRR